MEGSPTNWPALVGWIFAGVGPAFGILFGYLRDRDKLRHDKVVVELEIKLQACEERYKTRGDELEKLEAKLDKTSGLVTSGELKIARLEGEIAALKSVPKKGE